MTTDKEKKMGLAAATTAFHAPPPPMPGRRYDKGHLIDVMEQIQEAVRTLRRMPAVMARNSFTCWPDFVQNFFEAYGYTETTYRVIPTAKQIDRVDEVIDWLTWVPRETAKIIWARAERRSWRRIAAIAGIPPSLCRERFRIGIVVISFKASKK